MSLTVLGNRQFFAVDRRAWRPQGIATTIHAPPLASCIIVAGLAPAMQKIDAHPTVLYPCCAGLDVHKKTVVACMMLTAPSGLVSTKVRTFATTTADLLTLADWLSSQGVTHVAMESTGTFWRLVFNLLEGSVQVILVNAQHRKAIPGHKTDVKESAWLADLLRHSLLKASFIPAKPIRDLRDLVRYRQSVVQARAQAVNRVQKVLETATIKLSSMATDVLGKSGRDMLAGVLAGITEADAPGRTGSGSLACQAASLAWPGRTTPSHSHLLGHIDFLQAELDQVAGQIDPVLAA